MFKLLVSDERTVTPDGTIPVFNAVSSRSTSASVCALAIAACKASKRHLMTNAMHHSDSFASAVPALDPRPHQ
jgi:hypothetical protein